jgi:hypothetical protein
MLLEITITEKKTSRPVTGKKVFYRFRQKNGIAIIPSDKPLLPMIKKYFILCFSSISALPVFRVKKYNGPTLLFSIFFYYGFGY